MSKSHAILSASTVVDIASLGETLGFMRLLWAIAHGLELRSKRMRTTLGVTGQQRLALRIIGHYGRMSAGDLAQVLHLHPSSLTGVLRRLEQAELLRREQDPFDRRRAILKLTRRGERLNAQHEGTIEATVARTIAKAPKARLSAAQSVLKDLAESLNLEFK
ncbi:MAG TPA: MarR family transcriptional regulator [Polyangiaceae bacterium]